MRSWSRCSLGFPTSAIAQIGSGKLPVAKEAAASFAEQAKGSEKSGDVPRTSDPAIKKLLDAIFDINDIATAKTISFDQLSPLNDRLLTGNQVGLTCL